MDLQKIRSIILFPPQKLLNEGYKILTNSYCNERVNLFTPAAQRKGLSQMSKETFVIFD